MTTPTDTDSKLLKLLRSAEGKAVSGEELSGELGLSRAAVWKHVRALRAAGYRIGAASRSGYSFVSAPDKLLADEIRLHLGNANGLIGRHLSCFAKVDSTNRLAMEMAAKGAAEGLVIFAEEQTKGRGRLGRTWVSPKSKGIYFSALLRPRLALQQVPKITLMAAVAVARALRAVTGVTCKIRWPNDLLVDGRKICGILTEMHAESDRIAYLVLGIGINVNSSVKELPEVATSLKTETRKKWDRCEIAAKVLRELDAGYAALIKGRFSELAQAWEEMSAVTGHRIAATTLTGRIEGTAVGIDEDGALWIRQDSGIRSRVLSADIIFMR